VGTLARAVLFTEPPLRDLLTADDLERLLRLFPAARARFWGTIPATIPISTSVRWVMWCCSLARGFVRAAGGIGDKFRNEPLADVL
jgi:hypothetical protein